MVRLVGDGDLTARSTVRSGDDIGKLAAGLNHMADHLQKQRETLLQSERKYRGIFENAVEGIFSDPGGRDRGCGQPGHAGDCGSPES